MPYRRALLVILLALIAPVASRAQEATPSPAAAFTGETFVGMTADGQVAIAVVIGEETNEGRDVRAYLCDGSARNDWLLGGMSGERLDAEAENGTSLIATRNGLVMTGTIFSPTGQPLLFTATRASGAAGLFAVTLDADGVVTGTSAEGRALAGRVAMELSDGSRLIAALIEQPDGTAKAVAAIATADAAGEQRWIVQMDGSITGGFRRDAGTGFAKGDGSIQITDGTSNT
jgi:hypothetical protein